MKGEQQACRLLSLPLFFMSDMQTLVQREMCADSLHPPLLNSVACGFLRPFVSCQSIRCEALWHQQEVLGECIQSLVGLEVPSDGQERICSTWWVLLWLQILGMSEWWEKGLDRNVPVGFTWCCWAGWKMSLSKGCNQMCWEQPELLVSLQLEAQWTSCLCLWLGVYLHKMSWVSYLAACPDPICSWDKILCSWRHLQWQQGREIKSIGKQSGAFLK